MRGDRALPILIGALLWLAPCSSQAQTVFVQFEFRNSVLRNAEGTPADAAQTENLIGQRLVALVRDTFLYWDFKLGTGSSTDYRVNVWVQRGSDWDLCIQLALPDPAVGPEPVCEVLFAYGEVAAMDNKLPHGREWAGHVGQKFQTRLIGQHKSRLFDTFKAIPIGRRMILSAGGRSGGAISFIPAAVGPLRKEASQLVNGVFRLEYRSSSGIIYALTALGAGTQVLLRNPDGPGISVEVSELLVGGKSRDLELVMQSAATLVPRISTCPARLREAAMVLVSRRLPSNECEPGRPPRRGLRPRGRRPAGPSCPPGQRCAVAGGRSITAGRRRNGDETVLRRGGQCPRKLRLLRQGASRCHSSRTGYLDERGLEP